MPHLVVGVVPAEEGQSRGRVGHVFGGAGIESGEAVDVAPHGAHVRGAVSRGQLFGLAKALHLLGIVSR